MTRAPEEAVEAVTGIEDSSPLLNSAAQAMTRSGIREIMDLAYRKPGAIRLEIGDPDFATPPHIIAAANSAAREGSTHYTPNVGIPELRAEIVAKVRDRNGYAADSDHVVVTQGATQGIFAALLALTNPGDAVLLPDPAWPNYLMMAQVLRLRAITYPLTAASAFLPTADQLDSLVSPKTRVLVLNSPSNPLGAVINENRMRELLAFAAANDLWVIADECYDEIIYNQTFVSAAAVAPERVISAYSFSKTYAMTGWRVGYLLVPGGTAETVAKCQEPVIACVNTPAQHAALAALRGPQDCVKDMRSAYQRRRDLVISALESAGMTAFRPSGAFYAWIDVTSSGLTDHDFALRLLDEHGVATAPGSAFGPTGSGYVRVSLAASDAHLTEGIERLSTFLSASRKTAGSARAQPRDQLPLR